MGRAPASLLWWWRNRREPLHNCLCRLVSRFLISINKSYSSNVQPHYWPVSANCSMPEWNCETEACGRGMAPTVRHLWVSAWWWWWWKGFCPPLPLDSPLDVISGLLIVHEMTKWLVCFSQDKKRGNHETIGESQRRHLHCFFKILNEEQTSLSD